MDATKSGAFALNAQHGRVNFLGQSESQTWGFNQPFLGPTLRVATSAEARADVTNRLDEQISVHWHGLVIPGDVDGGPHQTIAPGENWSPVLPIDQPAATVWYHTHTHGETARQVYNGLAGVLQLSDGLDDDLGGSRPDMDPVGAHKRNVTLDMAMGPGMMMRGKGNRFSISGQAFDMSRIDMSVARGEMERWTISADMMMHPFHVHGVAFQVLSENGRPPKAQNTGWKDTILINGQADILMKFDRPASESLPYMFHCHILEHEDGGMMGQFAVVQVVGIFSTALAMAHFWAAFCRSLLFCRGSGLGCSLRIETFVSEVRALNPSLVHNAGDIDADANHRGLVATKCCGPQRGMGRSFQFKSSLNCLAGACVFNGKQ